MDKTKEMICLNALYELLDAHIDNACYSLSGPKESAICLEANDRGWEVYDKERSAKEDNIFFDNIVEACLEMIERLFKKAEIIFYKNAFLNSIVGIQQTA